MSLSAPTPTSPRGLPQTSGTRPSPDSCQSVPEAPGAPRTPRPPLPQLGLRQQARSSQGRREGAHSPRPPRPGSRVLKEQGGGAPALPGGPICLVSPWSLAHGRGLVFVQSGTARSGAFCASLKLSVPLPRPEARALLCPGPRRGGCRREGPPAWGSGCPWHKQLCGPLCLLPDNFFSKIIDTELEGKKINSKW